MVVHVFVQHDHHSGVIIVINGGTKTTTFTTAVPIIFIVLFIVAVLKSLYLLLFLAYDCWDERSRLILLLSPGRPSAGTSTYLLALMHD